MAKQIQELRDTLFDTIEQVKNGKMEIDKAKAITGLAQVLINSAKVEVDYIKNVNGTAGTGFIGLPAKRN